MKLPILSGMIKKECNKIYADYVNNMNKGIYQPMRNIPEEGWSKDEVIARLEEYHQHEHKKTESGKYSGIRFTGRKDVEEVAGEAAKRFLYTNLMYIAKTTPSRQMENEVISFVRTMLNGDDQTTGMTTTGGSESIFLALLAHKRYYFKERGITKPELIMPETAHAAFYKACQYLDIKYNLVKCDRVNGVPINVKDFKKKINDNTICLVASSPCFPFGTVDPIEQISKIAGDYGVGFFIDGCMGSLLLPFVDDFGVTHGEKYLDLRVKNVTAYTCDIHKYGNTPKGISVVLFPNVELKKALYFALNGWCGGIYGTPSIQGSRAASCIAAAWAVMVLYGRKGYANIAKEIFDATDYVVDKITNDMGKYFRIIGNPKLGNISIASNDPKVKMYDIGSIMESKGWFLGSGLGTPTLMCTIHEKNVNRMPELVEDLQDSLNQYLGGKVPPQIGYFKVYGEMKGVPDFICNQIISDCMEGSFDISALEHGTKKSA